MYIIIYLNSLLAKKKKKKTENECSIVVVRVKLYFLARRIY